MATEVQTRAGADQFTGAVGEGLFSFADLDNQPRNVRVVIRSAAYEGAAGDGVTNVELAFVRPAGPATARILVRRWTAAELVSAVGTKQGAICGRVVPRDPPTPGNHGVHWRLEARTVGKTAAASVSVDFTLQPFPDEGPAT